MSEKHSEESNWSWVCNECGSHEFTSSISESDIEEYLACSGCGSAEFHKEYVNNRQNGRVEMSEKHYAERDIMEQGNYYMRHLMAMTAEKLHSKSDIAAELAHRDMVIDALRNELARLAVIGTLWEGITKQIEAESSE
jgi:DNA-directed RNA polymerase subunit RPC12/RpoP